MHTTKRDLISFVRKRRHEVESVIYVCLIETVVVKDDYQQYHAKQRCWHDDRATGLVKTLEDVFPESSLLIITEKNNN